MILGRLGAAASWPGVTISPSRLALTRLGLSSPPSGRMAGARASSATPDQARAMPENATSGERTSCTAAVPAGARDRGIPRGARFGGSASSVVASPPCRERSRPFRAGEVTEVPRYAVSIEEGHLPRDRASQEFDGPEQARSDALVFAGEVPPGLRRPVLGRSGVAGARHGRARGDRVRAHHHRHPRRGPAARLMGKSTYGGDQVPRSMTTADADRERPARPAGTPAALSRTGQGRAATLTTMPPCVWRGWTASSKDGSRSQRGRRLPDEVLATHGRRAHLAAAE